MRQIRGGRYTWLWCRNSVGALPELLPFSKDTAVVAWKPAINKNIPPPPTLFYACTSSCLILFRKGMVRVSWAKWTMCWWVIFEFVHSVRALSSFLWFSAFLSDACGKCDHDSDADSGNLHKLWKFLKQQLLSEYPARIQLRFNFRQLCEY